MKFTALFAELIVIGTGTAIGIFILVYACIGYLTEPQKEEVSAAWTEADQMEIVRTEDEVATVRGKTIQVEIEQTEREGPIRQTETIQTETVWSDDVNSPVITETVQMETSQVDTTRSESKSPTLVSEMLDQVSVFGAIASSILLLSLIYMLGVAANNIGYLCTNWWEKILRDKKGFKHAYHKARIDLFTDENAGALINSFEFRRSKIRICRGWLVNTIIIFLAVVVFICISTDSLSRPLFLFFTSFLALLVLFVSLVLSFYATVNAEIEMLMTYRWSVFREEDLSEQ